MRIAKDLDCYSSKFYLLMKRMYEMYSTNTDFFFLGFCYLVQKYTIIDKKQGKNPCIINIHHQKIKKLAKLLKNTPKNGFSVEAAEK